MFTYITLNIVFLAVIIVVLRFFGAFKKRRFIALTIGLLLLFTAIFDSLIVGLGIVDYNPELLLGVYIGAAPVEDFFYAILAGVLVPVVWQIGERFSERKK